MSQDGFSRGRESQNQLVSHLLDVLIDPSFILELKEGGDQIISGANPAFFHLMRVADRNEILGRSFGGYLDPLNKTPLHYPEEQSPIVSDAEEPLQQEHVFLRGDQSHFLAEIRMKRFVCDGSSFLLVMVRDITEMKQSAVFQDIWQEIDQYIKNEKNPEYLIRLAIEKISGTFPFPEVSFSNLRIETSPSGSIDSSACSALPSGSVCYTALILSEKESITMTVVFRNPRDLTQSLSSRLDIFSQKMEKALEHFSRLETKTHKDALFELAPDGICLLDLDSLKVIGTNPVFCRLMGFPDESFLLGSSVLDWWELSEDAARKILRNVIDAKSSSFSFEQRHARMDGSHILASISGTCIPYGDSWALMLHVRDITSEHEAEILNRISVELDQQILRGAPIMNLLDFIVRRISLEFSFQIVFFTIPEPQGKVVFIGIDPAFPKYSPALEGLFSIDRWDLSPGRESSFGRSIQTGLPQFVTGDELEHSALEEIYRAFGIASVFSVPVTRDDGQLPWGALTIADQNVNDLSERLRARLIELSERIRIAFIRHEEMDFVRVLKLAMESSRNIEIIAFKSGSIEWANASFFKTIQSDNESFPDLDLARIFPEPAVKGEKITLTEVIAQAGTFTGEFKGVTRAGNPFLVETMVVPLKDRFGIVDRVLIQQKDITREREIELIDRLMSQLDEMILLGTPFSMLTDLVATKARELFYAEAVAIGIVGADGKVHAKAQSAISPVLEQELREWANRQETDGLNWSLTSESISMIPGSSPLPGWMNKNQIQEFRRFPLTENNRDSGYIAFFFKRIGVLEPSSLDRIEKLARRFSLVCERYQQEEQRRLHETAMSTVTNGILITGPDRRIEWVNDAFLQMSGYRRDELIGQTPFILRSCPDKGRPSEGFWKTILSGETFEGFLEDQKRDGSGYMIEATITPIRLSGDIKNFVVIQKDQTQRIQQEREIWRLAHTDHLTGLLNRQAVMEQVGLEISRCVISRDHLALLFLDLDGFKKINDTWGHAAGDFFLKTIGERILASVRASDIVARLGGDEFVVLLKNVSDQDSLVPFLDTFVNRLSVPVVQEERTLVATVSVGVSLFPKDAGSAEEMIQKADMAMYRSKKMGKNRWCFC